jgi:hypothetical protein
MAKTGKAAKGMPKTGGAAKGVPKRGGGPAKGSKKKTGAMDTKQDFLLAFQQEVLRL